MIPHLHSSTIWHFSYEVLYTIVGALILFISVFECLSRGTLNALFACGVILTSGQLVRTLSRLNFLRVNMKWVSRWDQL